MRSVRASALLAGIVIALTAACGGDDLQAPLEGSLSSDESAAIAEEIAAAASGALDPEVPSASVVPSTGMASSGAVDTFTREFTQARACPLGGEVVVEGEVTGVIDQDARTVTVDFQAKKTPRACALNARGVMVSIDGNPHIELKAHRMLTADGPVGEQTLSLEGSFRWEASDGRSGECSVDVDVVFDPASGVETRTGTICGHDVSGTGS